MLQCVVNETRRGVIPAGHSESACEKWGGSAGSELRLWGPIVGADKAPSQVHDRGEKSMQATRDVYLCDSTYTPR